jgi:PAS domain S-box-containing protein
VSIESRLNFEKVISTISSQFVGKINLDKVIDSSFQEMGNLSNADRVSLFLFNGDKSYLRNTHEWCANGINSQINILQKVSVDTISWWITQVERISFINLRDVSDLPKGSQIIRKFMDLQGIKSLLAFPIYVNVKLKGFVCFIKVLEKIQWKGKDFAILRIFAQILGDTIERLTAEEALQESQELLRATFEATADGIIAVDNNNAVTHLNERFIYMWRVPDDIIESKDFRKLLDHILNQLKDPENYLSKLETLEKTSKDAYDMIFFRDGRIFEQFSCPLVQDGQRVGRVWSFKDVTEHQHAEQELRKSETKFREAYERAEFFKDIFTHDMNNIFHNIMSSAELISILKENSENMDKVDSLFQTIDNQIKRGVKLINNVRKLSKLEETEISLEEVEIFKVLDEAIQFAQKSAQDKRLNIKINKQDKKIFVKANEFLLDVFENILHNSTKYNTKETVKVIIDISKIQVDTNNYIRMEFKDNGIGIIDEYKSAIFQKGHHAESYNRGMGIGLSLVKKIVESYSGKIWVENSITDDHTKGSNFILELPESV